MKFWRRAPRWLRLTLIALVVVIGLAIASLITVSHDQKQAPAAQRPPLVNTEPGPASGAHHFQVPAGRVPQNVTSAEKAAPITLAPGRWESDPQHADGQDVPNLLAANDRARVAALVGRFIKSWESFPSFKTMADFRDYQAKLRPLVTADALDRVARRVDNIQPAYICPEPGCAAGSRVVIYKGYGGPGQNMEIRSYDAGQQSVYAVAYAVVRYTGKGHPLTNRTFNRSYGLVLRKVNGRWLVARAAADTTGPAD